MGNTACTGTGANATLAHFEHTVGQDGYVEWDTEMLEGAAAEEKLSEDDAKLLAESTVASEAEAHTIYAAYMQRAFRAFSDDVDLVAPMPRAALDAALRSVALDPASDLAKEFNFAPDGPHCFPTVEAFVEKIAENIWENLVFRRVAIAAHKQGIDMMATPRQGASAVEAMALEWVAYSYVLHVITETCMQDRPLLGRLYAHFEAEKSSATGALHGWRDKASLFELFKVEGVKRIIPYYVKEDLEFQQRLADAGKSRYSATFMQRLFLAINILEAMSADYAGGHHDNAEAGFELALMDGLSDATARANKVRMRRKDVATMYRMSPMPRNWTDLYQSWDGNFIFNEFAEAPLFAAKLVTPAVGDYDEDPEVYMTPRVIALYLHSVFVMRARAEGTQPVVDWRNPEFNDLWGRVNLIYARRYRACYDGLVSKHTGILGGIKDKAGDALVRAMWSSLKTTIVLTGNHTTPAKHAKRKKKVQKKIAQDLKKAQKRGTEPAPHLQGELEQLELQETLRQERVRQDAVFRSVSKVAVALRAFHLGKHDTSVPKKGIPSVTAAGNVLLVPPPGQK